ncbi:putative bifunctional diguanylate cyclase/phosphodiesterase [Hoeflea marina]|uniref:putative bifunctional diguanylate cyclase/phosphodiesterase n=1 Tax=Hoeflea marina TaxID=274592 RepID=UPI001304942B|nr:EAL domain-containing protein [Hoeflea marina]
MAEPLSAPSTASPADRQSLRLIFAYETAAILILAVSLFWTAFFASRQQWPIAAADLLLAGLAAASWAMIRAGSLNSALIVSEVTLMIFTVCYALMFDEPSADIPRITHLYLLVIAMLGYINHLRRRSAFQLLVTAACLVGFIVLSSTTYAFPFARTIPDDIRAGGIWVNSILATAMLCGGIYAIQKEFTRPKGLMLDLSNAVRNRELRLHFQPQVDRTGQIIGAEALMRWQHPDRGLIPPNDFIPAAEAAGLMPLLGGWALAEACRTLSQWQDDPALARLTLAVNVSASQFQLEDFERTVLGTVRRHRIDPARLKLELTESVIVHALAPTVAKMNALRAIGITFALDDFGTGYSSLSYLRRLPVDQLKIDRSFVQESLESDRGGALVRSIVHLGIDLGFVVLAEGIETSAQHAFLLECGCHEFQGYHFGRPVDAAAFADHVRQAAAGGSPALLPAANDRTRRSA